MLLEVGSVHAEGHWDVPKRPAHGALDAQGDVHGPSVAQESKSNNGRSRIEQQRRRLGT